MSVFYGKVPKLPQFQMDLPQSDALQLSEIEWRLEQIYQLGDYLDLYVFFIRFYEFQARPSFCRTDLCIFGAIQFARTFLMRNLHPNFDSEVNIKTK